jgi:hypothetical protein
MNYKTLKTSKSDLVNWHISKNITHDIVLKDLLNLSRHFVNVCKSILNFLLTPTSYIYDEASDTSRTYNRNYYIKDITDLKLKASQRTFL